MMFGMPYAQATLIAHLGSLSGLYRLTPVGVTGKTTGGTDDVGRSV